MKTVASIGKDDVAVVHIVELENGRLVECVEAVQPPIPRDQKWVLMISTLYGCPVGCSMCDAGGYYHGRVSAEDMFAQIDFLIRRWYPNGNVPCNQFKIQFARMGDPAFNPAVLDVIESLQDRYQARGFLPSISTIAPQGTDTFFDRLRQIKREKFSSGQFQFQFSIHTTNENLRDKIIPVKKWSFERMAEYGRSFYAESDRKVTLNFALMKNTPIEPDVLLKYFSPDIFLIKITPLNATYHAAKHKLASYIDPLRSGDDYPVVKQLRDAGYHVIVSIGEMEENYIGSNCGQYIESHLRNTQRVEGAYTYPKLPAGNS
jgi:23S rRNA (adenine2503-C2)-methyltransferase